MEFSGKEIEISALQDFYGSIEDMQAILTECAQKYGPTAKINFDAGYNNVQVYIVPTISKTKR